MDHTPFIFSSYLIGAVVLFGYAGWLVGHRLRLRKLERALEEE